MTITDSTVRSNAGQAAGSPRCLLRALSLLTAVLMAVGASACSRSTTGSAVRIADAGCEHVSAPLMPIVQRDEVEPLLRIPLPDGWKVHGRQDPRGMRWSMWSAKLARDGYAGLLHE